MNESEEKKRRIDIVFGIFIAAAIGFALNVLANFYYDLFVTQTVTWDRVNQSNIVYACLILIALIGFLQFFIYDYQNDFVVDRSLIRRFGDFFFYKFTPGKILRYIFGIYILIVVVIFLGFVYSFAVLTSGYIVATLTFLLAGIAAFKTEIRQFLKNLRHKSE